MVCRTKDDPARVAHGLFASWSDDDRETVWITQGDSSDDFYGRTVAVRADDLPALIARLTALAAESPTPAATGGAA